MSIASTCSRLGCRAPAASCFGFDALGCVVWLDPVIEDQPGAGFLCSRHADLLSPPRGWTLLDRRQRESRLWVGRPGSPAPKPAPSVRAPKPAPVELDPLPFFDAVSAGVTVPSATRDPAELEDVLDARTPLLARAFGAARGRAARS